VLANADTNDQGAALTGNQQGFGFIRVHYSQGIGAMHQGHRTVEGLGEVGRPAVFPLDEVRATTSVSVSESNSNPSP